MSSSIYGPVGSRLLRVLALLGCCMTFFGGLSGCAMVKAKPMKAQHYIEAKRGDILTTGQLSGSTRQTLNILGLEERFCLAQPRECAQELSQADGASRESGLAAAAEVWMARALVGRADTSVGAERDARLSAWLEVARHAYAYLFFTERTPAERGLEERQTQVRDYYNYAVERVVSAVFAHVKQGHQDAMTTGMLPAPAPWTLSLQLDQVEPKDRLAIPEAMLPASALRFKGIRNQYRRDGFGTEMVAVMADEPVDLEMGEDLAVRPGQVSFMPTPNVTLVLRFGGHSLSEVLDTTDATLYALDPLLHNDVALGGFDVPLAANYTAGYGVWLAQSGFAGNSLRTLFGMKAGLERPHLFLLQPYDPQRRVLLLVHGLASSPEAWVNLGNDVLGDETLRKQYQIWLMYYPTNLPLAYNHMAIRATVLRTLNHLDPDRNDPASSQMVLVGHSMGGVISRLMVSTTQGDRLWNALAMDELPDGVDPAQIRAEVGPLLTFDFMPEIGAAVFVAAPHRGSPKANGMMAALVRKLSRVPLALQARYQHTAKIATDLPDRLPLSIDNLSQSDPFIKAIADLPIRPGLEYHSIIAREKMAGPLLASSDGVVPYTSAHLDGALSESIVQHGHSVQENPQAILLLRRILRRLADR